LGKRGSQERIDSGELPYELDQEIRHFIADHVIERDLAEGEDYYIVFESGDE